jgi:hypothetical protein
MQQVFKFLTEILIEIENVGHFLLFSVRIHQRNSHNFACRGTEDRI